MKPLFSIIILCFLIVGCESQDKSSEKNNHLANKSDSIANEQLPTDSLVINNVIKCNCESVNYNRNSSTDLMFQNHKYGKSKNEELFDRWSHDSLVSSVKSISFSGFDTIPKKYSIFNNVERLYVKSRDGIYGLDIFPKLHSVHFFDSVIDLDTDENWLNKLETFIGVKTRFYGLNSFQKTPNLKVIYMGFSGFEEFPKDLENLDCLYELNLGAYMFGEIDLSKFDFSKNRCLKKIEFQTWYNTLSGIPKGILASNIEELKIDHQKLTELEKKELEELKNHLEIKYTKDGK